MAETMDRGGSGGGSEHAAGAAGTRRGIARAAVAFFVVLILLTFFSKTLLTLSLPHIAVAEPTSGALVRQIRAEGSVAAALRSDLSADGRRLVREVRVQPGDTVRAGAILVVLDAGDLQGELDAALKGYPGGGASLDVVLAPLAEARLSTLNSAAELARMKMESARARLASLKTLQAGGAATAETVNRAQLDLSQALQDLMEREESRDQRRDSILKELRGALIVAPVAGVVTTVNAAAGGWVESSPPVISILPAGALLEAKLTFPLEQAKLLSIGESVDVVVRDGSGRRATSVVTRIAETAATGGGYREASVTIPRDSDLRPGDAVEVSLQKQTRAYALIVPNAAIAMDAQGPFVWVLQERGTALGTENWVVKSYVKTDDKDDFMTAIASGLDPSEKVLVRSSKPLAGQGGRVVVE